MTESSPEPPAGDAPRPLDARRLGILIASVGIVTMCVGGIYLVVVALKPLAAEFNWPREVPSLAFSLQFIGAGFGGLIMGYLLDRLGYAVPALVGGLMIGAGAMLISGIEPGSAVSGVIAPRHQLLLTYGLMFGLMGQGCILAPGMANIAKFFNRRRGMAVGIVSAGQSLVGIIWPPIFGPVMAEYGWREMFFWYGVLTACVIVPLAWFVRHRPGPAEADARPSHGAASGAAKDTRQAEPLQPATMQWILCAAITGCCIAMALPLAHTVSFITDLDFSVVDATQVMAVMLIAAFVSRAVMVGLLADSLGGLTALFAFSLVQAATLALFTVASSLWSLYLVAIIFGVGYGGIFPVYTVVIREHIPLRQVGRRTGMVFLFGSLAMGLGSWLGGYLFDLTGSYTTPYLLGVAFNIVNLVIVAMLIGRTGGVGRPKFVPG